MLRVLILSTALALTRGRCVDNIDFRDQADEDCTSWIGYDCAAAADSWGFTKDEEARLLENCPTSCDLPCATCAEALWQEPCVAKEACKWDKETCIPAFGTEEDDSLCAPDCLPGWVNDTYCDAVCNTAECDFDGGDCEQCAEGCLKHWVKDGACDEACNTAECQFDEGDCVFCAEGCGQSWPGDGQCDEACNNTACNFDDGDCSDACAFGCPPSWPGDGFCDAACNNAACNFDNNDCYECSPGCSAHWIGDRLCDEVCNVQACEYDGGDCELVASCADLGGGRVDCNRQHGCRWFAGKCKDDTRPEDCRDEVVWRNNDSQCRNQGKGATEGCELDGYTCFGYEQMGWCEGGVAKSFTGQAYNFPEDNCCACGKPFGRGLLQQKYNGYYDDAISFFTRENREGHAWVVESIDKKDEGSAYSYKWSGRISCFSDTDPCDYEIRVTSDDAAHVYLDGVMVLENPGLHDGHHPKTASFSVAAKGRKRIEIYYGEFDGEAVMLFEWSLGGGDWQTELTAAFEADPAPIGTTVSVSYMSGFIGEKPPAESFALAVSNAVAEITEGFCAVKNDMDFSRYSNQETCPGGNNANIAFKFVINFNAPVAGEWEFDFNVDFGWGGIVYFDGQPSQQGYQDSDLFAGNDNTDTMDLTEYLERGPHLMEVFGAEDCCDSSSQIRFRSPGDRALKLLTVQNLESLPILIRTDVDCLSTGAYLGHFDLLTECADKCRGTKTCEYFVYGNDGPKGDMTGKCFQKHTDRPACPQGFEEDSYDFFELKSYTPADIECDNKYDTGAMMKPWDEFVSCAAEKSACAGHKHTLQVGCAKTCGTCDITPDDDKPFDGSEGGCDLDECTKTCEAYPTDCADLTSWRHSGGCLETCDECIEFYVTFGCQCETVYGGHERQCNDAQGCAFNKQTGKCFLDLDGGEEEKECDTSSCTGDCAREPVSCEEAYDMIKTGECAENCPDCVIDYYAESLGCDGKISDDTDSCAIIDQSWICEAVDECVWKNGKCFTSYLQTLRYEMLEEKLSWPAAQRECENRGGSLATIGSDSESLLVWESFGKPQCSGFWIGYNDRKTEGKWTWADGSKSTYNNWHVGEPNNNYDGEDCAFIGTACLFGYPNTAWLDKWNDIGCEEGESNYRPMQGLCEIHGDPLVRGKCPGHEDEDYIRFDDKCYLIRRSEAGKEYEQCAATCAKVDADIACPADMRTLNWIDDAFNEEDSGDPWIDGTCLGLTTTKQGTCFLVEHGQNHKSAKYYESDCKKGDTQECICELDLIFSHKKEPAKKPNSGAPDGKKDSKLSGGAIFGIIVFAIVAISVTVVALYFVSRMRMIKRSGGAFDAIHVDADVVEVYAEVVN